MYKLFDFCFKNFFTPMNDNIRSGFEYIVYLEFFDEIFHNGHFYEIFRTQLD